MPPYAQGRRTSRSSCPPATIRARCVSIARHPPPTACCASRMGRRCGPALLRNAMVCSATLQTLQNRAPDAECHDVNGSEDGALRHPINSVAVLGVSVTFLAILSLASTPSPTRMSRTCNVSWSGPCLRKSRSVFSLVLAQTERHNHRCHHYHKSSPS